MFDNLRKTIANVFQKSASSLGGLVPFRLSAFRSDWGKADYLNFYEISLYANKCIDKRAQKVGEIEFKLYRGDTEITNDPLLQKLYKPNKFQTQAQFFSLWSLYKDIFGEVYVLVDGDVTITGKRRINDMHILRSDMCNPKFDPQTGELVSVEYSTPKGTHTFDGDQIIYDNRPDPKNPRRGNSLLMSGIRSIETSIQIDEYHARVLSNGGRVEGIFKFKNQQKFTQKQLDELRDQYDRQYADATKAGRPLFLAGESDYVNLGLSPSELSYLETKKVTLEDILMLTGVPKIVLGSFDDIKYDNADVANRIFLKETIRPILSEITSVLDTFLFPDGLDLTFEDPTPENIDLKLKQVESGIKNYYMTVNEAREMSGLEPIAGEDQIYRPFNLIGSEEEPAQEPNAQKAKSVKEFDHPLRSEANRRLYEKIAVKRMERQTKKMKRAVDEYFKGQAKRIIESVSPEQKHVFRKKDLISEVFIANLEIEVAKQTFLPVLEEILIEAGVNAREIVGNDYEYQFTANAASWLDKKVNVFSKEINDTTFKKLKSEFAESFAAGETRTQLVERIENTYDGITKARAETIAATEVHAAGQFGTLDAYKQAGLPIKIWVSVGDSKVRSSHQIIDGEEVPLNDYFSNGLQFPGDPAGSAAETINCRCVI